MAWHKEQLFNAYFDSRHSAPIGKGLGSPFVTNTNMHTMGVHTCTKNTQGEKISGNQRGRHRHMKRLNYPKVGGRKAKEIKKTERGKFKRKDTKNKETLRHTEQEKGEKMAQERQKGHVEKRYPR